MTAKAGPAGKVRRRLRRFVYRVLDRSPSLYCGVLRRRGRPVIVAAPGVHLVIEGFPRSGNSFAREAAIEANAGLHVGSHVHEAAHVLHAVALGIPTLVLVRAPEAAITSVLLAGIYRTPAEAMRAYKRFYRRLWRHRRRFEVATFEQVISDFGSVIDRLNARYSTTMARFEHDAAGVAAVLARLDEAASDHGTVDEWRVARPSTRRLAVASDVAEWVATANPRLLASCRKQTRHFQALAERAGGAGRTRPRQEALG